MLPSGSTEALCRRAAQALADGDNQTAVHLAKRSLVLDPENIAAARILLDAYSQLGRKDDACVAGYRLLELSPHDFATRLDVARIELSERRAHKVIDLLREVASEDRAAAALIAAAYGQLGQSALAKLYEFGVGIGSGAETGAEQAERAYFAEQLAGLLESPAAVQFPAPDLVTALRAGRYLEVEDLLRDWFRQCSNPTLVALAAVDWALMKGDIESAESSLERCDESSNHAAHVSNRLGDIAILRRQLKKARHRYRKATVLDRRDMNAWLDLARTEFMLGDVAAAKSSSLVVLKSDASNEHRWLATQYLHEFETAQGVSVNQPGVFGMVWWEKGGGLLEVETEVHEGEAALVLTGNVGRQLEDAVRVAYHFVQQHYGVLTKGVTHVHFPGLNIPKDGGSVGALVACVLLQEARGVLPSDRVGITGELGLGGTIRGVGGLREKVIAASLHGLSRVFYPTDNEVDIMSVPVHVRRSLRLIPVRRFSDLADNLF